MKSQKVIYYETEQDEIVPFNHKRKKIDENYKYIHKNPFYKIFSFITYRILATPFAFISFKLFKKIKFHNVNLLKKHKKDGYFVYANHSNQYCDGFCPALICFPKKPHIIVNPANVSIPFLGKFTQMWGALPLPENIEATKNFYRAIDLTLKNNNPIVIYPEKQLWPYHTKIRDFSISSFRYPVKFNKPVFTFTTTYKKFKNTRKPKIEIYVDGPFYPNQSVNPKEAQAQLKEKVFNQLCARASLSDYEFVKYIKKEKQ